MHPLADPVHNKSRCLKVDKGSPHSIDALKFLCCICCYSVLEHDEDWSAAAAWARHDGYT